MCRRSGKHDQVAGEDPAPAQGIFLAAHCTGVGKALLSGMDAEEIDQVIAARGLKVYTPNTITRPKRLMQELEAVRRIGVASLSLSGPAQRFTPAAVQRLAEEVQAGAGEISRILGFVG